MSRIIPSQVDWLATFMHKAGSGACICEGQEIWAAVNEIESLRQQLAEAQKSPWISVEDRLPRLGDNVAILISSWGNVPYTGYIGADYIWHDMDGEELHGFNTPNYWMPFPAAPMRKEAK